MTLIASRRCSLLPSSCRPAKQERLIIACLGAMLAARAWRRLSIDHLMGTATTYIKVRFLFLLPTSFGFGASPSTT